jgi:tetratricopeptide (TPR) repeat protein
MDLRRFLNRQPVVAAPPSTLYRMDKFVRRHRIGVATTALVAAALVAAVFSFAQQARVAKRHAEEVAAVSRFQGQMLEQVDPNEAGKLLTADVLAQFDAALDPRLGDAERKARHDAFAGQWSRQVNATDAAIGLIDSTILRPAVATIDKDFADQPLVAAELRQVLATRYHALGLFDAALPLQQAALATRRERLGGDDDATLESMMAMGQLLTDMSRFDEAEPLFREALDRYRRTHGENDKDTVRAVAALGIAVDEQGRFQEALPFYEQALPGFRRAFGERAPETLEHLNNLGYRMEDLGRDDEALRYYEESLAGERVVMGNDDQRTLTTISNLGSLHSKHGRPAEAEKYFRESLDGSRRTLGNEHLDTLISVNLLGGFLMGQGKLDDAEPLLLEALETKRRVLGPTHSSTFKSMANVVELYIRRGRLDDAARLAQEQLAGQEAANVTPGSRLYALEQLANIRIRQGRPADALALLAPVEAQAREVHVADNRGRLVTFLSTLAKARAATRDFAAAEKLYLESESLLAQLPGNEAERRQVVYQGLADLHRAWEQAEPGHGHQALATQWRAKAAAVGTQVGTVK